jgi:hypothetical protein
LAEHVLGKDEVTGSIPVIGSSLRSPEPAASSGLAHYGERRQFRSDRADDGGGRMTKQGST